MAVGRLAGKIAFITGGASGMGEAMAIRFANEGAQVVIGDLDVGRGEALAGRLGDAGRFVRLDVRYEESWKAAVADAENHFGGPIGVLVNNAGVLREASVEETTMEEFRFVIDVMQVGVYLGMRYAAPSLRRGGGGSIINVSSTAGIVGYAGIFAYTAAKWAVRGMTKAAALDLAPDKIRVNSIHPGDTETPMIEGRGYTVEAVPLKRFAKAEEIANLALFLASDESQYITGAEHIIDGGLTAG